MNGTVILFYSLSAIVLVFAAVSMLTRKIFRAALCLLASLVGIAGLYLLWDMDFIAALQIIIYVGGIVVLIIFSIFLTHKASEKLARQSLTRMLGAMVIALSGFCFTAWILLSTQFPVASPMTSNQLSVEQIGIQMISYDKYGYLLPFEVISFLLLGALVGSIVIAIKHKKI